jgi:Glycosyltransferase sugar-binding region containing DXD motif
MIPRIFHFIYFTSSEKPPLVFPLSYYIAVKSALEVNKPDEIIFHFDREPTGEWWEKIKPHLTLHQMQAPDTFMGKPIIHPAHKADVVRLLTLKETGGIYLDLDTICVKPLTPFLEHSFVIGEELEAPFEPKNKRQEIKHKIRSKLGLVKPYIPKTIFCNGVLLAEKNSPFIDLWIQEYKTFRSNGRDKFWNEHSSIIPGRMAQQHPDLITIAGPYCFHYPLYTKAGMKTMFEEVTDFHESYIHHVWESFSRNDYLSKLSVEEIQSRDTTYNLLARKIL